MTTHKGSITRAIEALESCFNFIDALKALGLLDKLDDSNERQALADLKALRDAVPSDLKALSGVVPNDPVIHAAKLLAEGTEE